MAIRLREGRWALSRIVSEPSGFPGGQPTFRVAAMRDRLAQSIEAYYPPLNDGAYTLPFALVRLQGAVTQPPNADTRLIPAALVDATLRDLTAQQRQTLRGWLEEWFTGYQFRDYDGTLTVKQAFSAAGYTLDTPVRRVLLDVFGHLGHSDIRPRIAQPESHNTEYLDDFSTDPFSAPRWTNRIQTTAWDSTNGEMDTAHVGQPTLCEYTANTPGSIEHESQVTTVIGAERRINGPAVRVDGGSANDFYALGGDDTANEARLWRRESGTVTQLATNAFTVAATEWLTFRVAAAGAAGANVVLDCWHTNHGGTKPSDPGWYGADGTPDFSYTDTAANRLDASTHDACGIGGAAAVSSDFDPRFDFWKSRAISDRSGGASAIAGTCAMVMAVAGAAAGDGTLSGSAPIIFAPAASIVGDGALVGSSALIFAAAAALAGDGALAGQAALQFTPSASLVGDGALAGLSSMVFTPAGDLTAVSDGAISGVIALQMLPSGAIAGDGALAGSLAMAFTPAGALAGDGAVAGQASLALAVAGAAAGVGALAGVIPISFTLNLTPSGIVEIRIEYALRPDPQSFAVMADASDFKATADRTRFTLQ